MKVWTVTTNEDGADVSTAVFATKEQADKWIDGTVTGWWWDLMEGAEPPAGDWQAVYAALCENSGFLEQIAVAEHDVTPPPSPAWTVLLMMPDYWRGDQPCAADEIVRVWVEAAGPAEAEEAAYALLPALMADEDVVIDDFATVAIYPGHHFDQNQA